ncbi:FeoB-associated Cys-rich membrane protein [Paenibacillus sp. FSL R5-0527]|uniref:FeoB-associated Cys-rich membrane protein n=1 Tax=Paenibacillus TaxID=44249 RepID=UPI00097A47B2|nr:FeoB-associated Cys-rich membrane protein [Paenibacillus macerans]MEC0328549.1 FeoB-associated Cys-rich membrane protein [Paenibacillus macerans]MED4955214.1 FeoB-associated Cys-rich membrane protein [Paenibacillus macerans]OMG50425.1 hypothetical protein BK140_05730 [Paenibacillus macerans]
MLFDIVIVTAVFAFAGYSLYRGFKKSKKGACASCSQQKTCSAACSGRQAPPASSCSPAKPKRD